MMHARAVFFDKDGTLLRNVPDNVDPTRIRFASGALSAVRRLHRAGYRLIVVTNQGGVARGVFPEHALQGVAAWLRMMFSGIGVPLTGFYYCPHDPAGSVPRYAVQCDCRKPRPGLIQRAAKEHGIDLKRSWFVGDILHDVEAGRAAGCRTVLIDNGNETEWQLAPTRMPNIVVDTLAEAASAILVEHYDEAMQALDS